MRITSCLRGWIALVVQPSSKFKIHKMNGQSKISSFFSRTPMKRATTELDGSDVKSLSPKKKKVDENEENLSPNKVCQGTDSEKSVGNNQTSLSLSPEQKQRIDENKRAAQAKLLAKNTEGLVVNFGTSWYRALETEFAKEYFLNLSKFVASERNKGTVYPPPNDVFSWTNYCTLDKVKVVILGQDPYHGPKQAHGLCFSVQKGVAPPPSLQNMYKELQEDIQGFKHPGHGTLIGWASQGVLLLNACLTVRAGQANSHKDKGWETFTDAVISWLNKNKSGLVFILWGSYAQKKGARIDKKKHHVLSGVHPSPLSAHRGFFGCKHFSKCNEFLKKEGKSTIDWNRLPPQD